MLFLYLYIVPKTMYAAAPLHETYRIRTRGLLNFNPITQGVATLLLCCQVSQTKQKRCVGGFQIESVNIEPRYWIYMDKLYQNSVRLKVHILIYTHFVWNVAYREYIKWSLAGDFCMAIAWRAVFSDSFDNFGLCQTSKRSFFKSG